MWRRALVLTIALACSACAAASSASRPVAKAGRNVITAAEIVSSHVTDVYQAVLHLRPEFLRRRAAPLPSYTSPQVLVYLDDMELGYAESLRSVPLGRVRQIKYLSRNEADLRWPGRNHPSGAIQVVTKP